ncbi:hypothetical protein ACIBBD_02070 [Streptomyces sp. NPDC051315]|uniref:hypothetical protein n=1 Tax=Streptomyces sp. NPDC051315 TaxID=3365650 RepID=UPI0037B88422
MNEPLIPASEEVTAKEHADRLIATAFRDDSPIPARGTAEPVPQPGRAPMSQRAVDASALMLSGGVASVLVSGSASLVLAASGIADPTVIGIVCAAPAAVAVPIWAVTRMLKNFKHAVPDIHHHHYNAPVDQRTQQTKTSGLIARTNNQQ